jgi:hypothetical protein
MIDPHIPEGIRSKIMKAFIAHVQNHPLVSNQIRTWQVFAGEAQDHDIIPLSRAPAIRVTYSGPGQYPVTFSSTKADFSVNLELILPGTNQFAMLDMWEVLEEAIDQFGSLDTNVRESLKDTKLAAYGAGTIGSPAINHAKYKNPPGMVGTGSVNFTLSIRR